LIDCDWQLRAGGDGDQAAAHAAVSPPESGRRPRLIRAVAASSLANAAGKLGPALAMGNTAPGLARL